MKPSRAVISLRIGSAMMRREGLSGGSSSSDEAMPIVRDERSAMDLGPSIVSSITCSDAGRSRAPLQSVQVAVLMKPRSRSRTSSLSVCLSRRSSIGITPSKWNSPRFFGPSEPWSRMRRCSSSSSAIGVVFDTSIPSQYLRSCRAFHVFIRRPRPAMAGIDLVPMPSESSGMTIDSSNSSMVPRPSHVRQAP